MTPWSKRQLELGNCIDCGSPRGANGTKRRCAQHAEKYRAYQRAWAKRNPASSKKWEREHPNEVRRYKREYWQRNKGRYGAKARANYAQDPQKFLSRCAKYRAANPDKIKAAHKSRRPQYWSAAKKTLHANPEKLARHKEYQREYRVKNRERLNAAICRRLAERMKTDLDFAMRTRLRKRIAMALKGSGIRHRRVSRTVESLGCSIEDFRIYIESKFEPGMTWENWGKGSEKWNLDHIMPCAIFDLSKPEHQKRCFHFSNYQPLWQPENIRKGARVATPQLHLI